jgi:hypothetical protein
MFYRRLKVAVISGEPPGDTMSMMVLPTPIAKRRLCRKAESS